jgi:putative peptidoglycan lipid II flippase
LTPEGEGPPEVPLPSHFRPKPAPDDEGTEKEFLEEPPTNPGAPPASATAPVPRPPPPPPVVLAPVVPASIAEPVTSQVTAAIMQNSGPKPPSGQVGDRAPSSGFDSALDSRLDRSRSPRSAVRASDQVTVIPGRRASQAGPRLAPAAGTRRLEVDEPVLGQTVEERTAGEPSPGEPPPGQPSPGQRGAPVPSSARNAAIMAAGTSLSRVSGFGRVLAVAWVLGQARLADAYNQANTVPNTVYDLLLGGVLSATLLPVLMQSLTWRPGERDDKTVPAIVTFLTVVLLVASGVFWFAAPEIIHFFLSRATGPGVADEQALATTWLRLFAPQLLFIGLITITTALLNARRRFGSVAFSPVLANLVTIGALVVANQLVPNGSLDAYQADRTAVLVVGLGTTAGYLAQLLAQLPALFRADIPLRPRWDPRHPALLTIARLSAWTIGAVVANQISFILISVLANTNGGNLSSFMYAYTFMQLPYAIIAVSIAYAVAPDLAELWTAGNTSVFAGTLTRAMRVTLALLLPAGVGYALLARPAALLALAHGHLSASSAEFTGSVLTVFAVGLPGFSAYLLLMRAFQSKQDTRSMFWLYAGENALTVVAALVLYPVAGVKGLAAAWIGSYTVALPFAWRRLRRSAPITWSPGWLGRVLVATGVMAGVVYGLLQIIPERHSVAWSAARLVVVSVAGGAVFVGAARALGIEELSALRARYRALAR